MLLNWPCPLIFPRTSLEAINDVSRRGKPSWARVHFTLVAEMDLYHNRCNNSILFKFAGFPKLIEFGWHRWFRGVWREAVVLEESKYVVFVLPGYHVKELCPLSIVFSTERNLRGAFGYKPSPNIGGMMRTFSFAGIVLWSWTSN